MRLILVSACLLALTAVGTVFASEVRFPSAKLEASDPDTTISGQLYKPDGAGPYPAVVLLHTCGGLSQHMTHDWPQFLVGLGYVVLSVDTLSPRGYFKGCRPLQNRHELQA
jgi:dienelactone hydrolase